MRILTDVLSGKPASMLSPDYGQLRNDAMGWLKGQKPDKNNQYHFGDIVINNNGDNELVAQAIVGKVIQKLAESEKH